MTATLRGLAGLLAALGRAGVELAPHPSDLTRLRHRPAALAPDLIGGLRHHREAILVLLMGAWLPGDEAAYVFGERLGAADGLGMPTHAGSPAWLVAVGEAMDVLALQEGSG